MAGGIFSGSGNQVRVSGSDAEAAALRAEEAAAEAIAAAEAAQAELDAIEVYDGQTVAGDYTVPNTGGADPVDTLFLDQTGTWSTPAGNSSQNLVASTGITIEGNDISVTNPFTDTDETKLDDIEAGAQVNVAPTKAVIDALGVDAATVTTFTVGVNVPSDAEFTDTTYLAGDGLTLDPDTDTFSRDAIALTGLSDIPAPVASQYLQRNADDDGYVWSASAATVAALTDIGDIPAPSDNTVLARNSDNSAYEWVADNNSDTTYTGSDGITLTGTNFTLTDSGINEAKLNVSNAGTDGQVLSRAGTGFTWIDDSNTDTTYTADEDTLNLTGTVFSVAAGGVDTAELADGAVETTQLNDNAVTLAKMADNSVGTDELVDVSITGAKIANGAVDTTQIASQAVDESKIDVSAEGTSGQVLTSDGDGTFSWSTPAAGTNFTASDGITLASDDFSLTDSGVTTVKINDGAVTSAKIADNAVTATQLNVASNGSDGQYLVSGGTGQPFDWVDAAAGSLADLTDTNIPNNITDRRFLEYNTDTDMWDARAATEFLNVSELFDVLIDTDIANNQFLRYNSTDARWENKTVTIPGAVAAGTGISVSGSTVSIADDGVTNSKLADNSVRTENIVDLMVTQGKIADGAIDTTQLANDAVTAAKIADNTITATQVAPNSLGATELASNAVSSFKLQTDSVTTIKVTDEAITEPKLSITNAGTNGQVLSRAGSDFTWIDNGSGGITYTADGTTLSLSDSNEFSIADVGVDTAQIATDAITATQIQAGAVGTTELADNAVETVKINDSAVTNSKLGTGAVNTSKIFDGAITAAKLGTGSVTSVKIGDNAVTNAKLGTDILISTLSDVNTSGVNNGQILTYNGTTWVPTNNSGGGNTDNSRLNIALSPSSFNMNETASPVTITLSIGNPISGETISGQSVTLTDPLGHTAAVSGSGNTWTFSPSTATAGNYVIRASATFTTSESTTVHSANANLPIHALNSNYYQTISATAPTAVSGMTDNGVYNSPETVTYTGGGNANMDRKAYVALPTRSAGYNFTLGVFPASDVTTVSTLGEFTLYRINDADFDDTQAATFLITITEA